MTEPTKTSSQPEPASSPTSSPSPSNAGNTDASASTPAPTPTLGGIPPPLKAHVLDYLPHETVEVVLPVLDPDAEKDRRDNDTSTSNRGGDVNNAAASAPKNSDGGVAGAITTLNITSGTQLDGSLTDRFPNVEEVNCLSFLRAADDSPDDERILVVCRETATRLVPVLSLFSKLRRIYVGGGFVEADENGVERLVREEYWYSESSWPDRERLRNNPNLSLASSLAYQLIGALKARVIPPLESMDGVDLLLGEDAANTLCPGFGNSTRQSEDPQKMCECCRDVCSHLPLGYIAGNAWSSSCVDKVVLFETIAARDGKRTKELLCDPDGWCVMYMSEVVEQDLWDRFHLGSGEDSTEAKELKNRLQGLGADGGVGVWYMDRSSLNFIDRMIAAGWHPDTSDSWFRIWTPGVSCECIAKGTYDALVSRGFPTSESDNVVVDELVEPALKSLPALMSRWFIRS